MNHLAGTQNELTSERGAKYIITATWVDYPPKQYFASMTCALYRRGMDIDAIAGRLGIAPGAVETIIGGER